MLARFRKIFLVVSALGYGFLGCGPSLWALDLGAPDPVMQCLRVGCTCSMHPGKMDRAACCCLVNAALLKKFPALASSPRFWKSLGIDPPRPRGTCRIQPDGCDLPEGHGMAPVPQQAHFPKQFLAPLAPPSRLCPFPPALRGRSCDPQAPIPGPD